MLRAYAGTLAVIVVPGFLFASILGLRLREVATWAAVPAFSLAIVFLLGEATLLLSVPFGLPAFGLFLLLLVVLRGALAVVRSRRSALSRSPANARRDCAAPVETRIGDRVAGALLALGVALGALTWHRGLRGVALIPPGGDATRHGWFVERIISGHTIDPSRVVTSDVAGAHAVAKYYPLALHAAAALSTVVSGSDVGRVLVAYTVVFSAVVLPVGMFVLARALAPDRPLVAGFTALVVPLLMLFPYFPVAGGDLPQMVGMALVPSAVVLLLRAMLARHPQVQLSRACLVALAPAALAILCISALHTSELPFVVFLTLLLVLEHTWRTHDARMLRPALVRGVAVGALAAALFAPTLFSFAGGVSERASIRTFVSANPASWQRALEAMLRLQYGPGTVRQGFLAVLALTGAALWLMSRRPAWVAGCISVVLLGVFTGASKNSLADDLTFPWYHLYARIVPNLAFFVPFFAGVTLGYAAMLIMRVSRRSRAILPATLAMMAVFAVFVGIHGYRANSRYIRASFDPNSRLFFNQALVTDTSLEAFRWLHLHAARGDTIANEPAVDGSLWMYAEQHVSPLIGTVFDEYSSDLVDRLYLTEHLQSLGHDIRADDVARHYHTRWVFFDTHMLLIGHPVMKLADLKHNPHLTAVFHKGGTWVFRIDL